MSVLVVDDSSIFAFSAASLSRCNASGSCLKFGARFIPSSSVM